MAFAVVMLALVGLRPIRARLRRSGRGFDELVVEADPDLDLGALVAPVSSSRARLQNIRIDDEDGDGRRVTLVVRLAGGADRLLAEVASVPGVREAAWANRKT